MFSNIKNTLSFNIDKYLIYDSEEYEGLLNMTVRELKEMLKGQQEENYLVLSKYSELIKKLK